MSNMMIMIKFKDDKNIGILIQVKRMEEFHIFLPIFIHGTLTAGNLGNGKENPWP